MSAPLQTSPCSCFPLRDQSWPGDQCALSLPHFQTQWWHHRECQWGAGGQVQRWDCIYYLTDSKTGVSNLWETSDSKENFERIQLKKFHPLLSGIPPKLLPKTHAQQLIANHIRLPHGSSTCKKTPNTVMNVNEHGYGWRSKLSSQISQYWEISAARSLTFVCN